MNIEQLGLFKQKILNGSIEICKGNVTPAQIYNLANKALEEALTIHSVVGTLCKWKSHNYEVENIGMCGKCNGMHEIK